MTQRHAALIFPALSALLLSACANKDSNRYPSLAIRDVERIKGTADTVEPDPGPAPPVPPSADLVKRLAQLHRQAADAHDAFSGALPGTQELVNAAAGSAVASESWSVAQAALARLQAKGNPALIALADLDRLYVDSELAVGAVDAISAERDAVRALVNDQEQAISALAAKIPE